MVRHARRTDDKQVRREVILDAANRLFLAGAGTLPAAAEIAAAAGLGKGTLYIYFRTKEEIFIALLLKRIDILLGDITATFAGAKGRRADKIGAFLASYVGQLHRHPELLRLDALGYGVLEKNLDQDKLHDFKRAFVTGLGRTAGVVEAALRLPPGRGIPLLTRTFAMTRGLWQSSHAHGLRPADVEPALAPLFPAFDAELTEALTEYWRGAVGMSRV